MLMACQGLQALRLSVFLPACVCLLFLASCATTPELPTPPPKYVYQDDRTMRPSQNSLWVETASLYEDVKARRLNDLVTIKVVESITGSGSGTTNANKDSSTDNNVQQFFGIPRNLGITWSKGNPFVPEVTGYGKDAFKGSADTARVGSLVGTITARVVEVMPNKTLVIESRKEIAINRENQILVLRGAIRPDDIAPDNSILSTRVADAKIFFVGKGVVEDKQGPGWLVHILDKAWPF